MNYSKWKPSSVEIDSLLLDLENPRLTHFTRDVDEKDLMLELLDYEDVLGLAHSISLSGIHPTESLLVIKGNKGKYIVVEGNRRLTACKLLVNPKLAPTVPYTEKFKDLNKEVKKNKIFSSLKKLKVVIATSREEADTYISQRHTEVQIKSWKRLNQSRFHYLRYSSGESLKDLSKKLNITVGKIKKSIILYNMYQEACSLTLPKEIQSVVHDPRRFLATTLERAYLDENIQLFLGLSFDENGDIKFNVSKSEFKKRYKVLVSDVATKIVTSRNINTAEEKAGYIEAIVKENELSYKVPTKIKKIAVKVPFVKGKAAKKKKNGLIPLYIDCTVKNSKVCALVDELKFIVSGPKTVYACTFVLRALLEQSLYYHLKNRGFIKRWKKEETDKKNAGNKNALGDKFWPGLKYMLDKTAKESEKVILDNQILDALNNFLGSKSFSNKEFLNINLAMHNHASHLNEADIVKIWKNLEELFKILLIEPKKG